ncbi:MAG TPA: trypsin-like peptidase domain-containing protein [Alloiococcus sp.]|nr:trypsin-like peptidase domain-containing protein [Alloiococcus sp.]
MNKRLKSLLYMGAASTTLIGCTTINEDTQTQEEQTEEPQPAQEKEAGETQVSEVKVSVESDITEAVKEVENSVVTIINKQRAQDPLSQFGIENPQDTYEEGDLDEAGTGSGAVYRTDGDQAFVFTNNHVVAGSDAIEVMFSDGEIVEAEIVGADEYTDLAVLSIDAEHVESVAEFGDSKELTLGEPAIAVGSPLGGDFALSVTSGVVSGVNRTVPVDNDRDGTIDWEMTAIQTDAAINPGNSGGPLVNVNGQVIGINSMKISSNVVEGMGFAIPSNDAVSIINELETNGEINRPVLGVSLLDSNLLNDQQIAEITGSNEPIDQGAIVVEVASDSAAAEADIQAGDVFTSFNGEPVKNSMELKQAVYTTRIGDTVEAEIIRDGEPMTVSITMKEEEMSVM